MSYGVGAALGMHAPEYANAGFAERLVKGTITGFAAGAAASLARGGRVTVQQVAMDAFGNALGNSYVDNVSTTPQPMPKAGQLGSGTYNLDGDITDLLMPITGVSMHPQVLEPKFGELGSGTYKLDASSGSDFLTLDPSQPRPRSLRAGDFEGSLERIARAQLGTSRPQWEINEYVGQLFELNSITNARNIQPDQMILLPDKSTPAATNGLALYTEDIIYGERLNAKSAVVQRQGDQVAQTLIDPGDGMRIGPTIERAQTMGRASFESTLRTSRIASDPTLNSGLSAYDKVSLGIHSALGVMGAFPVLGAIPDAIDLVYTAAEYPFGKSSKADIALGAVAFGASIVPGVDQGAAAAKIAVRAERNSQELMELSSEIVRLRQEGHSIIRHGEEVTDQQLFSRVMTGVASDGSSVVRDGQIVLPSMSTAFNSNELLARSDRYIRENYLDRAIALSKPGSQRVVIEGVDVGTTIGRGYERVAPQVGVSGPALFHSELSRATVVYELDSVSKAWKTLTIYPVK